MFARIASRALGSSGLSREPSAAVNHFDASMFRVMLLVEPLSWKRASYSSSASSADANVKGVVSTVPSIKTEALWSTSGWKSVDGADWRVWMSTFSLSYVPAGTFSVTSLTSLPPRSVASLTSSRSGPSETFVSVLSSSRSRRRRRMTTRTPVTLMPLATSAAPFAVGSACPFAAASRALRVTESFPRVHAAAARAASIKSFFIVVSSAARDTTTGFRGTEKFPGSAARHVRWGGGRGSRRGISAQLAAIIRAPAREVAGRHGAGVVRSRGYRHDSRRKHVAVLFVAAPRAALVEIVQAPASQGVRCAQRAGVGEAGDHLRYVRHDVLRGWLVAARGDAELVGTVFAPAEEITTGGHGAAVIRAKSEEARTQGLRNRAWRRRSRPRGSSAQLTGGVLAPAQHLGARRRAGMGVARGNGQRRADADHLGRLEVLLRQGAAVADLAEVVPSPTVHLRRGGGAGMPATGREQRDAGQSCDLLGCRVVRGGPIAELPVRVVAPTQDLASGHGAGVRGAGGDIADRAGHTGPDRLVRLRAGAPELPLVVPAPAPRLSAGHGAGVARSGPGRRPRAAPPPAPELSGGARASAIPAVIGERSGASTDQQQREESRHGLNSTTSDSDPPGRTTPESFSLKKRASAWRSRPSRTGPARVVPCSTAPARGPAPVYDAPRDADCEATEYPPRMPPSTNTGPSSSGIISAAPNDADQNEYCTVWSVTFFRATSAWIRSPRSPSSLRRPARSAGATPKPGSETAVTPPPAKTTSGAGPPFCRARS